MQLNADIVSIQSLYFESDSKRLQPEEEYSGLYGTFTIVNWSYSIYLDNIHSKLAKHVYFMVLSHSMRSQYKSSKNLFLWRHQ